MASLKTRRAWRTSVSVVPLIAVILSSLIWSGYATFQHAEGPEVPGSVAWTLIAALDGTVVVTTPVWLSTVLPRKVRNYAAVICCLALAGSMLINFSETGWPGVFPPLIAGALIHLVGVVLRAFAELDRRADAPASSGSVDSVTETVPVAEEQIMPSTDPPQVVKPQAPAPAQKPHVVRTAAEVVYGMLERAERDGAPEPTGAELTQAVRGAGHDVNDAYGRTTKARWKRTRADRVAA